MQGNETEKLIFHLGLTLQARQKIPRNQVDKLIFYSSALTIQFRLEPVDLV